MRPKFKILIATLAAAPIAAIAQTPPAETTTPPPPATTTQTTTQTTQTPPAATTPPSAQTTTQTTQTTTQLKAAMTADIKAGAKVSDQSGGEVGKVESIDSEGVVVSTGSARVKIPLSSFGVGAQGLVIGTTKADLEAAAKKETKKEPKPK